MIIKINIDQANLDYLKSVCGGIQGTSRYINRLIFDDRKEHEDIDDSDDNLDQMLRLHRHQEGFTFPTMIRPRGQSGSIRRPWRTTIRRGTGE